MKVLGINSWYRVFEPAIVNDAKAGIMLPMKRGVGVSKLGKIDGGAAAYGVFISLLPIAMAAVPRGTLVYTDREGSKPHDAESISLVTGFPVEVIQKCLAILMEIGWLEHVEFEIDKPRLTSKPETLYETLQDVGAKLTFRGESLIPEWEQATKGLGPKRVRTVFEQAKPGINYPREFVAHRARMGI